MNYILNSGLLMLGCSVLVSCTTIGGFDPAKAVVTDFKSGAAAGKAFVSERNKSQLRSERKLHLQWLTGSQGTAKGGILKPGHTSKTEDIRTEARDLICEHQVVRYQGVSVMNTATSASKALGAFDYQPSEKILGNLKLISSSPEPEIKTDTVNVTQLATNAARACEKDFEKAISMFASEEPPTDEDGVLEAGGVIGAAIGLVQAFNATIKPKVVGALQTGASYQRRRQINSFITENKKQLTELQTNLKEYATEIEKNDQAALEIQKMAEYIFAFEAFANKMTKTKINTATVQLFKGKVVNLEEIKEAQSLILAAESYDAAKNTNKATAIKSLAGTIDGLLSLTEKGSIKDHYDGYKAADEFIDSLSELAKATKDEDLKKALEKFKDSF